MRYWRTNEVMALADDDAMRVAVAIRRTPRAVQDKARRLGIPAPKMRHARYWPEGVRRRARALRQQGAAVSAISVAVGVPFGTVRRWVYDQERAA